MNNNEVLLTERLPPEIITYILSYLSTQDRKNARLVNSSWYEASKHPVILKHQKFVHNGSVYMDQMSLIFDVLHAANYRYYNLAFNDGDFHRTASVLISFLAANSNHIYSLSFSRCSFPLIMLGQIMTNCPNLKELLFYECYIITSIDSSECNFILEYERQLLQKNLTTLIMNKCDWLTNDIFNTLIRFYPNIKKIDFSETTITYRLTNQDNIRDQNSHHCNSSGFSFQEFYRHSGYNLANLQSLSLNKPVWSCIDTEEDYLNEFVSIPQLKLEELNLKHHNDERINFSLLFSQQTQLKSLDLRHARFDLACVQFLFHQCPNLEKLQFSSDFRGKEALLKESLELMAKSRLKFLNIENAICLTKGKNYPNYPQNYNTYHLGLDGRWIGNKLLVALLKIFCNLTELDLSDTCLKGTAREAVGIIFQQQNKLTLLKMNSCSWINDDAFRNCKLSNLKRLELERCKITDNSITEFNFPELRFLSLEYCENITNAGFLLIPAKCPSLRYLNLEGTKVELETIFEICKNLKFLHHLAANDSRLPECLSVMSEYCPSLRSIKTAIGFTYDYNYFQKKWISYVPSKRR